jgi:phospholipid-binding lipoprotein MlaA
MIRRAASAPALPRGRWRSAAVAAAAMLALSIGAARAGEGAPDGAAEPSHGWLGAAAARIYGKAGDLAGAAASYAHDALTGPTAERAYAAAGSAARSIAARARDDVVAPVRRQLREALTPQAPLRAAPWSDIAYRSLIPAAAQPKGPPLRDPVLRPAALGKAPRAAALDAPSPFDLPPEAQLGPLEGGDPFERFNRAMFDFNGRMKGRIFDPLTDFYLRSTSKGVQDSVRNFFYNLREPVTVVSSLLEGEFADAGNATARFGINTTLGIAGLFDPAKRLGFPPRARNLEETLCVYGLPSGPYLILPILGPATVRDAIGRLGTVAAYYEVMGASIYIPYRVTDVALQYADIRDKLGFVNSISIDPYVAQRQLYLTTRSLSCGKQTAIDREFFTK